MPVVAGRLVFYPVEIEISLEKVEIMNSREAISELIM